MKNFFLLIWLCSSLNLYSQELSHMQQVHGPFDYYSLKMAKLSSLIIPPLYTTYKLLYCTGTTCPDPMQLGVSGLVWMAMVVGVRTYEERNTLQKQKIECSITELARLIGDFPEIVDTLLPSKRAEFYKGNHETILSFSMNELEKMFGGYVTYYGVDQEKKPCGQLIPQEDELPIHHPLITAWAENQYRLRSRQ